MFAVYKVLRGKETMIGGRGYECWNDDARGESAEFFSWLVRRELGKNKSG